MTASDGVDSIRPLGEARLRGAEAWLGGGDDGAFRPSASWSAPEFFERLGAQRTHPDMGKIVPEFGQQFLSELVSRVWT